MSTEKLTFEQAMSELETLIRNLETGKVNLDEAVKTYERGVQLRQFCEEQLTSAKMVVDKLMLSQDKKSVADIEENAL